MTVFLRKLLDTGVKHDLEDFERQSTRLSNLLAFLVIVLCVIGYLLAKAFLKSNGEGTHDPFLLAAVLCSIFMLTVPVLNHTGWRALARLVVVLVCCMGCFAGFLIHGPFAGADTPLIPATLLVFLLFQPREKWFLLSGLLIPAVTFTAMQFPFLSSSEFITDSSNARAYHSVASIAAFLGSLFAGSFYFRELATAHAERRAAKATVEEQRAKLIFSAKMAALGEMAGGIAHEINNPLTIIGGKLSLIRGYLSKTPLNVQRMDELCNSAEKTVFRIAEIVKGLRMFSRDASLDPLSRTTIESLFSDVRNLCSERLAFNKIALVMNCRDSSLEVACRPGEVAQILLNLIQNAADGVAERDEKWIDVDADICDDVINIAVSDSGNRISREIADKMFQPFFTTKDVGKGTGLGLSISKGLAEANGGKLEYDSSAPNTKFVLMIPRFRK